MVYGAEPIKIGILSFRSKPQTQAQWQPLATVLKHAMPESDFVVEALTLSELDTAVASGKLDFVLTNPAHYILLKKRSGLSAPLATLATIENGQPVMVFGGIIFTRADRRDINTLLDIKNKTVATTSTDSFGGYQMQAYELGQAGISLSHGNKTIITGMPHDNVIEAVLSARADVGFVRTGVLEGMVREGKLDIKQLKILNLQSTENYPVRSSTRLYPEWAFAAMPHVDEQISRHIAAALFVIEDNVAATRALGIHGFAVPADYMPVVDVLRELRVPPFDVTPSFTEKDIWVRYRIQSVVVLFAFGLIMLLGVYLLLTRRKLEVEHNAALQQQKRLYESESHLRSIIKNEPECIKVVDAQGRLVEMNPAGLAMIEADSLEQVVGQQVQNLVAPECRLAFNKMHERVITGEIVQLEFEVIGLKGGRRWVETHAVPIQENGVTVHLAVTRDITERKMAEEVIKSAALYSRSLIETSLDPLVMISPDGKITDVNAATERATGINRNELIYSDFAGYFTEPEKAHEAYRQAFLHGSVTDYPLAIRHTSGKILDVLYNASVYHDAKGNVVGVFAAARDITERKAAEAKLRMLSTAIEQSPASVVITNLNAEIEYVNPRFTEVTGYSLAEATGKNPRVLQSGLTDKSVYQVMWNKLVNGQSWVGDFVNKRKNGEMYFEEAHISPVKDEDGSVNHYVAVKLDVTNRKRMEEEVRQLALYDTLTKLPNRRLLTDRMSQAMVASKRNGCYGALMFIDLDNFKLINDTHGHLAGDLLLIEVASRLKRCVREMDTVARIGGDEFVVMLAQLDEDSELSKSRAELVAEKLCANLSDSYLLKVNNGEGIGIMVELHCTASIGVALFISDRVSQDDIMQRADEAMYQAKDDGRNRIRFYDTKLNYTQKTNQQGF